jgi:hypothetical protein
MKNRPYDKPTIKDQSFFKGEIQKSEYFKSAIESITFSQKNKTFAIGKLSDIVPNGIDGEFSILHKPDEASESNIWYQALVTLFDTYNCSVAIDKDTTEISISCAPKIVNFEKEYTDGQNVLISKLKSKLIDNLLNKFENGKRVFNHVVTKYPQIYSVLLIAGLKPTYVDLPKLFVELEIIDKVEDFELEQVLNPYTKVGAGMIAFHQYCKDAALYTGGTDLIFEYSFPAKEAMLSDYKTEEEVLKDKESMDRMNDFFSKEKRQTTVEVLHNLYGVPKYKLELYEGYGGKYIISGYYPELNEDNQVISWNDDDYLRGVNFEETEKGLIYFENYADALKEYNELIQKFNTGTNNTRLIGDTFINTDNLNRLLYLKTEKELTEIAEREKNSKSNRRRKPFGDNETRGPASIREVADYEDEEVED